MSETYHFVSIEHLAEQKIGKLLITEIYKKLNIDVTIEALPGKRASKLSSSGVKDGEIMRIFSYGSENPMQIRVPTPYYQLKTMAFIKKGNAIVINSIEDLKKYRLVKVRGVKHTDNITKGLANVYDVNDTETMMAFINKGRADIALTSCVDGKLVLKRKGITGVIPIDKPLAVLPLFNYIHKDHKNIIAKVDAVIKEMTSSGEMDAIIRSAQKKIIEGY